jgi:hypothetical protein
LVKNRQRIIAELRSRKHRGLADHLEKSIITGDNAGLKYAPHPSIEWKLASDKLGQGDLVSIARTIAEERRLRRQDG